MIWSPQQDAALKAVNDWLRSGTQPFFCLAGYAGTGKALAHDAKVQTPEGPRTIDSLSVGDEVVGASGEFVTVLGVYPQGLRKAYRVTFRDGFSIECSMDHLWTVLDRRGNRRTMTLDSIVQDGIRFASGPYKFRVPLCEPVRYMEKDLPLAPYLLGALLGDGTGMHRTPTLCLPDSKQEILDRIEHLLPAWATITTTRQDRCNYHRLVDSRGPHQNEIKDHLIALGVATRSRGRSIPRSYMLGSVEQRIELLRGLMDTDGSCRANRTSFSTRSNRLAKDVAELVQSLGGVAIVAEYEREDGDLDYHVNVKTTICPFHVQRKRAEWSPSTKNPPSRYIVSVEESRTCEHVCIKVDAEDGLFLADHYVVTHNTTLAQHFAENVGGRVLFGSFTGKAAAVMRSKGCGDATTIHRLIYTSRDKSSHKLKELQAALRVAVDETDRARLRGLITQEIQAIKSPAFRLNEDSPVKNAALVIIDECSMVGERMGRDLLSFGTPVLVLGDPAQLPPVGSGGFFTGSPDHMLTEVHRHARESGILRLATEIRRGDNIDHCNYGDACVIPKAELDKDSVPGYDQILVGKNRTRKATNARMREILGRGGVLPEAGDKLVCLKNDHDLGLLNGEIWQTLDAMALDDDKVGLTVQNNDTGAALTVEAWRHPFEGIDLERWEHDRETQEFDYGYVLTCHKAQGSEWPRVVVFDQSHVFGANARRWLYTAATRASQELTIVR